MRVSNGTRLARYVVAALLVASGTAAAQNGTIRGIVKDSNGVALKEVDVSILALHQLTRSDENGHFTLTKLPRGDHELMVRKLGYNPDKVPVTVNDTAYSYEITLVANPTILAGVDVSATEVRMARGIEEFYRRRARGTGGYFFTRDDMEASHVKRTSDALRTVPGMKFVRTNSGTGMRFQGNGNHSCTPTIWLDGQPVDGMEIDQIPSTDIEGIEIYTGSSTTPMQFSQRWSKDACGTIVIWTRIPGKP